MSSSEALALVRAELPECIPTSSINLLAECADAVLRPPPEEDGPLSMRMMVAMPLGRATVSISPRNLVLANPFNPRTLRDGALTVGAAKMTTLLGMSQLLGFLLVFTALISRPVVREEACVLHKAWQVARFDGTFSLADMMAVADDLRDDYFVEKISEIDIKTYLNNLELAGAIAPTPSGYRLVETIRFPFGAH